MDPEDERVLQENDVNHSSQSLQHSPTSGVPETRVVIRPPLHIVLQTQADCSVLDVAQFVKMTEKTGVHQEISLQDACRASILKALTLTRIGRVTELPIPRALQDFISTFHIPKDFDTDGFYINYNYHFPNHPHHKTHRVHPAVCSKDGTKVLIKVQNMGSGKCIDCSMLGSRLAFEQESDRWAEVNHPNMQSCYMKMVDMQHKLNCYVMEYPVISIKDLATRLSISDSFIPEFLLWDTIHKLALVTQYLQTQQMHNELMEPQHYILDAHGQVKLENLLLYLPCQGRIRHRSGFTNTNSQHMLANYTAPEEWDTTAPVESTIIWSLGCVFYEITALCPAFLLPSCVINMRGAGMPRIQCLSYCGSTPAPLPKLYSPQLKSLISSCLQEEIDNRPTLQYITNVSGSKVKAMRSGYSGPSTLLHLLPQCPED